MHKDGFRRDNRVEENTMTIGNVMKNSNSISFLTRKEKEHMLFQLRKVVEDFSGLELWLCDVEGKKTITPEARVRFHQYLENNKHRVVEVIWALTGNPIKHENEEKKFKDALRKA